MACPFVVVCFPLLPWFLISSPFPSVFLHVSYKILLLTHEEMFDFSIASAIEAIPSLKLLRRASLAFTRCWSLLHQIESSICAEVHVVDTDPEADGVNETEVETGVGS